MRISKIIIFYLLLGAFFSACISDDVDFDQAQNIELNPVAKVSLVYFKVDQSNFVDPITNIDTPLRFDFSDINVFDNDISENNVKRAILKIEIENTFNKDYKLDYYLIDKDNNTLDVLSFNTSEHSLFTTDIEYLQGTPEYDNLVKTTRIYIVVDQIANANTTDGAMFLHFKSAVDLYLMIGND